jgi:hypothetical protein
MKNRSVIKRLSRLQNKRSLKYFSKSRVNVFLSHNFSDIEDNKEAFELIRNLAVDAGNNAAAEAKARGLDRVYIRNKKQLVKIAANGEVSTIEPKMQRTSFYVKYPLHTVLHAVSK